MTGYILAFRPSTGAGSIVTASGETLRFVDPKGDASLHGGDTVSFDVKANGGAEPVVSAVTLVNRWTGFARDDGHAMRRLLDTLDVAGRSPDSSRQPAPSALSQAP